MLRVIYCINGWPLICFICWNETETSICRWLLFRGTSNSKKDAAWLTALQKQWSRVISQWVKISTKSYWLTGEKRDGGQWARLWDLAVVINTGVLPEGASDSVFIQSDTEQRSTIVQPHWRCQSTQGGTAGGVALADTCTHMRAHMRQPRAVVIDPLFTSKYARKSCFGVIWAKLWKPNIDALRHWPSVPVDLQGLLYHSIFRNSFHFLVKVSLP